MTENPKSLTVIMISHRQSTLAIADMVVVLNEGKVVEQGSYAELQTRGDSLLHALVGSSPRSSSSSPRGFAMP